jgi:hypothetical protein
MAPFFPLVEQLRFLHGGKEGRRKTAVIPLGSMVLFPVVRGVAWLVV